MAPVRKADHCDRGQNSPQEEENNSRSRPSSTEGYGFVRTEQTLSNFKLMPDFSNSQRDLNVDKNYCVYSIDYVNNVVSLNRNGFLHEHKGDGRNARPVERMPEPTGKISEEFSIASIGEKPEWLGVRKSGKAVDFIINNYSQCIKQGMNQRHLEKIDGKLFRAFHNQCSKESIDPKSIVPPLQMRMDVDAYVVNKSVATIKWKDIDSREDLKAYATLKKREERARKRYAKSA